MGFMDLFNSDDSSKAMERRAKGQAAPPAKPSPPIEQPYQGSVEENPDTQKMRQQGQKSMRKAFGGSD